MTFTVFICSVEVVDENEKYWTHMLVALSPQFGSAIFNSGLKLESAISLTTQIMICTKLVSNNAKYVVSYHFLFLWAEMHYRGLYLLLIML